MKKTNSSQVQLGNYKLEVLPRLLTLMVFGEFSAIFICVGFTGLKVAVTATFKPKKRDTESV